MLIGLVVGWAGSAAGQAVVVDGGSERAAKFESNATTGGPASQGEVLRAEVTHSASFDTAAVVGFSKPKPWFGYGGYFESGWRGVEAVANVTGSGERYGLFARGLNGISNFGVYGDARGSSETGATGYGVFGFAACQEAGACTKYAVYASGDLVYTGNHYQVSDLRFKESLAPLEEALGKLLELKVVSYEHVESDEVGPLNLPEGPRVGFIAQQVAEVLPELVGEVVHPVAADPRDKSREPEPIRYQALKPIDLIPYLVRALQEQQAQIEALQAQLGPLQRRLAQAASPAASGVGAR